MHRCVSQPPPGPTPLPALRVLWQSEVATACSARVPGDQRTHLLGGRSVGDPTMVGCTACVVPNSCCRSAMIAGGRPVVPEVVRHCIEDYIIFVSPKPMHIYEPRSYCLLTCSAAFSRRRGVTREHRSTFFIVPSAGKHESRRLNIFQRQFLSERERAIAATRD